MLEKIKKFGVTLAGVYVAIVIVNGLVSLLSKETAAWVTNPIGSAIAKIKPAA